VDAAEPQRVRQRGADQGQVGEAREVRPAQRRRRRALDQQRDRDEEDTARDELPAGGREQRCRTAPALGEDDPGGHGRRASQRGEHPHEVEPGLGAEHEQADPGDPCHARQHRPQPQPFPDDGGGQAGHDQGLDRADDRRDAAGQAVRAYEQQREEQPDVQQAEHGGAPPPRPVGQAAGQQHEQEPGRQRAEHGGQQRPVRWEELGGDRVGEAPRGRGQGGGDYEQEAIS
jgi:hypothetical protein